MRPCWRHLVALALCALPRAHAAEPARLLDALRGHLGPPPAATPSAPRTEPAGEVTLDYSPTSRPAAALAQAQRMEQQADWHGAAAIYQRLIDEAPAELCHPSPRLYVPIGAYAEQRLASFPAEGLKAYRKLADAHARQLYREAADAASPAMLDDVATRYLLSSVGDQALDRLATRWLARGDFGRALRAWARLARLCRDTDVDLLTVAAKAAVCQRRLGRADAAQALLARVASVAGRQATIPLGGQPTSLATVHSRLRELAPPAADDAAWPVEGGDRSQARTQSTAMRPGALLWSDVVRSKVAAEAALAPRRAYDPFASRQPVEPAVAVAPIVAGGLVVYPSRVGLLARSAGQGKVAWAVPWPRHQLGRIMLDPFTLATSWQGRWSCSAGGGRVYVSVPLVGPSLGREARTGGELMAVDARSGAIAWRRPVASDLPQAMESGWYSSAPLPCGERLVVGLRAGPSGEEFHLCCLRASDGRRLWRRYVCSRTGVPWYSSQLRRSWFEGMAAESEGLVVASPGGGVVGAVELATGRVQWLARCDQLPPGRYGYLRRSGWRSHTPLVSGGTVYATPPDADYLYALALRSGRVLWRLDRGGHRHLAAARDGTAYLAGTHAARVSPTGELEWATRLPTAVTARPALAGRVLHLPVAGGILYLDAGTGAELAWTAWADWSRDHGPSYTANVASGDVRIVGGRLLVTTPYTLNVFAPHQPRRGLEAAVLARHDDARAHSALAQELHWQGDAAAAASRFERALELAGAEPAGFADHVRRRLASCYTDIARREELAGRLAPALAACRRALSHAADAELRALVRLRAAALARRLRRWDEAAAAYQALLSEDAPHGAQWRAARDGLAALLDETGRAPYAPFERAAERAFAAGSQDDLKAIVRVYPHSLVAPRALLRLAETADADDARRWLRRVASDYPASAQVPDALHRLARGYAAIGARAMARGALSALRTDHPAWRPRPAGALDAEAFLAAHAPPRRPDAPAAPSPPLAVGWSVRPAYGAAELHVAGGDAGGVFVVVGLSLERRSARDGSLAWADRPGWIGIEIRDALRRGGGVLVARVVPGTPGDRAGLRGGDVILGFDTAPVRDTHELIDTCMARRSGADVTVRVLRDGAPHAIPLALGARPWQSTDPRLGPEALLGTAAGHALLRQPSRLDAIRLDDGRGAWSQELAEPAHGARTALAAPGLVAVADSRARLAALDPARGFELWQRPLDEPTVHRVALWDHGLVVASASPATVRVLNPFDGRLSLRVADRHAAGPPLVALDSGARLCYAMGSTIGCYDGPTCERLWSDRIRDFTARRLWAAGPVVVAHGADNRGVEALECRRTATGEPLWARSLGRGELLQRAALEPRALYVVSRRAARATVRRLDSSTGEPVWAHELAAAEELGAWEPSAGALCLGVTATDAEGRAQAHLVALDKLTGAQRQRVELGAGRLAGLRRVANALYAVVEEDGRVQAVRFGIGGLRPGEPPRFRVVRIVAAP